jgi:acetyl-CoA carboxylase carboxyl transferase subunit beta
MNSPSKTPPAGDASQKRSLGQGIFSKCQGCAETITAQEMEQNFQVCPKCGKHHRLETEGWKQLLLDNGSLDAWDESLQPMDPLGFSDGRPYPKRCAGSKEKTGVNDAIVTGQATLSEIPIAFGLFVFGFMGGSMGSVVGEKIARLFERAHELRLPVVLLQASGGARMQEGIFSLMQMAKTVAALERFRLRGLPFFSVLLHPTTGGVAASFALLGDINLAEPDALIGFAGPRVIESTIGQSLPVGFQRSEFLLQHGMLDSIVARTELKSVLTRLLTHLRPLPL